MWRFLKKLEIELPYDSAIPLLGIHIEETIRAGSSSAVIGLTSGGCVKRQMKQCCDEHWGARVSFNSDFLSVYDQQWDC